MYDQPLPQSIQFYMLYAAVAMATIIASCYLLLRRGNAFAPNNTPPVRLRRWTAALFASMALGHLWYLPTGPVSLSRVSDLTVDSLCIFKQVFHCHFTLNDVSIFVAFQSVGGNQCGMKRFSRTG